MLAGKGILRAGYGSETKGTIIFGYGSKRSSIKKKLIPPHPLTNFEIQKYYQNEPRFNDVYSGDNLPNKIKGGAYVINLDEYPDIGTHWLALYVNAKTITYYNIFQKKLKHFLKDLLINLQL